MESGKRARKSLEPWVGARRSAKLGSTWQELERMLRGRDLDRGAGNDSSPGLSAEMECLSAAGRKNKMHIY